MADYAQELLGVTKQTKRQQVESKPDYATEMFARPPMQIEGNISELEHALKRQQAGGVLLTDLPLANYDPFSDKWSSQGIASFGAQVKAALVDDPQTKLNILAADLFPDDPRAAERFGLVEGEPVYVGKDEKLYRATPGGWANVPRNFAAEMIGRSPSIIGGAIGGTVASGPVGTVAGIGLGAAGGEGIRKIAGALAFDEPQTPTGNLLAMGREGGLASATALLGMGLTKWIQRNLAADIGRYDKQAAALLQEKARTAGVQLTPAEITNLPSLKSQQKAIGKLPQSADIIDEFMQKRPAEVQRSAYSFFETLSPEDSVELAGRNVKEAASAAMERVGAERAAVASPLYQRAFSEFQGIPKGMLQRVERIRARLPSGVESKAIELAKLEGLDLTDPANSLQGMHYLKLALDDLTKGPPQEGIGSIKRALIGRVQKDLVGLMDDLSPTYKQARGIYAAASPGVERVREGLVGKLADVPESSEINVARILFDAERNGPIAVSRAMAQLRKTDPQAADDALRAFLQDKFEKAGREFASTTGKAMQGAKFRAAMMGNVRQRDILQAAMTGKQWAAFNDLMDVLEATGRAPMVGSDTAWNLEARRLLEKEAGGGWANIAGLASPQDLGNRVREALKSKAVENYAKRVAGVITSKDGMKNIKALKELPLNSQKRIIISAGLLGLIGEPASAEERPIQRGLEPQEARR